MVGREVGVVVGGDVGVVVGGDVGGVVVGGDKEGGVMVEGRNRNIEGVEMVGRVVVRGAVVGGVEVGRDIGAGVVPCPTLSYTTLL